MRRGAPRKGKETLKAIAGKKKIFIKEAKDNMGLLLDSPNGGGHKVNARDRAKIKRILRDINVISRVANSKKKLMLPN